MAKQTIYTDDLDETPGAHPVQFALQNKTYEIDLTDDHEAELAKLLSRYIENGREVIAPPPAPGRGRGGAKRQGRADLPKIRDWARQQGIKVSDRGRIKQEIIEAYDREAAAQ